MIGPIAGPQTPHEQTAVWWEKLKLVWYILKTPGTELNEEGYFEWIKEFIDVAAIAAILILLIFVMLGSKKAGRWVYWVIAPYAVWKLVAACL